MKCLGHIVSESDIETDSVKIFGHIVCNALLVGIGPDPDKIEKLKVSSQPTTHRIEFCPTPTTHVY